MNVVWTLENISGEVKLTEAEVATLKVSVTLWKRNNPNDTTIIYCDTPSKNYLEKIGLIECFDIVDCELLEKKRKTSNINKNVFWASAKIESLKATAAPLVHIDNDFFAVKSLEDIGLFKSDVAVSYQEKTDDYYLDPVIATANAPIKLFKKYNNIAYNTSLLYFKNQAAKDEYCNVSLKYMRKISGAYDKEIFSSNSVVYMIFAEQQILGEFCETKKLKVNKLINQVFCPKTGLYENKTDGLVDLKNIDTVAGHLGEVKKIFREKPDVSVRFAKNLIRLL